MTQNRFGSFKEKGVTHVQPTETRPEEWREKIGDSPQFAKNTHWKLTGVALALVGGVGVVAAVPAAAAVMACCLAAGLGVYVQGSIGQGMNRSSAEESLAINAGEGLPSQKDRIERRIKNSVRAILNPAMGLKQ